MDKSTWITLSGAAVSVATLIFTAINLRLGAKKDEVSTLEKKMDQMSDEARNCERRCKELMEENLHLLRELAKK